MVASGLSQGWQEARGTGRRALPEKWSLKPVNGNTTPARQRGAAKFLGLAALTGLLIMGAGCSSDKSGSISDLRVRPAAMDTSRLLRNAHYYKLMGRPEASLKEMEEAHRQDPDNLKIVDALAQSYQELGQFQRAQELYKEALARQGSNRALMNNWCFSYYLQGNMAKAESCFKEALARDPGNAAARNNLGLLWCRQGKLAEAQRLWEEAEGSGPAQNRLNQALAFLGMSPTANFAIAAAPKPAAPLQAAAPQKPATPVAPAVPAKPAIVAAPTPVKAPIPTPVAAAPPKPAAPVAPAVPIKPAIVAAPTPVKAPIPTPVAAALPKAELKAAAKAPEPKAAPPPQAAVSPKPIAAVAPAVPDKAALATPSTVKATSPAPPVAATTKVEPKVAAKPVPLSPPLTAQERELMGIEVRNGTRTPDLAHQTRSLLSQEGFTVAEIGNHIDFGAEHTVIYYRPEAQRMAQALNYEIFQGAKLEKSSKLKNGIAVKVLLGQDLLDQALVMARIACAGEEVSQPTAKVADSQTKRQSAAAPMTVAVASKPEVAKSPIPAPPAVAVSKVEVKPAAKPAEAKPAPQPQAAAPPKPVAPVAPAPPVKAALATPSTVKATSPAPPVAATPKVEPKVAAKPAPLSPPLTAQERELMGIEVRNGTRTPDLAHQTRSLLSQEGFTVAEIGNHIDFGAEHTVIYYRPEAQRMAQALNYEIFQGAKLEKSSKLKNGIAVKVLLGYDLLNQPRTMARLTGEDKEASPSAVNAKASESGPLPQPAAAPPKVELKAAVKAAEPKPAPQPQAATPQKPAAPVIAAAPAKAEPSKPQIQGPPPTQAVASAVKPRMERPVPAESAAPKGPLTAEELMTMAIEIRNGTRSRNLAHQARSLLSREGFNVGIIGNHIDFGAEATVIYYRPEAEKVARALNSGFFPMASLAPSSKLNKGMAIKVVLGRDLLDRPRLMSRLAEEYHAAN